jgi:hypothetical protein
MAQTSGSIRRQILPRDIHSLGVGRIGHHKIIAYGQTMRGSPTRNRAFACGCLRRLRYAGDGDMAAAATSLSRDLRSWSCGSGSIPIVDKMCSQR